MQCHEAGYRKKNFNLEVTQDRDIYVSELPKICSNESISMLAAFFVGRAKKGLC